MVRSLENFPELAPFRIALRSHRIGVQSGDPVQGRAVGGEVRQVHVVVAVYQQLAAQGSKDSWLVAAAVVGEYEVQSCPRFRLIFMVPVRFVPTAAVLDLFYIGAEQEEVVLTCP